MLIVCGWIGMIVLVIGTLTSFVNIFRGKDTKDRISAFITCVLTVATLYFIVMHLFFI
jgi:uncharacterized protein with PQ loop repeat